MAIHALIPAAGTGSRIASGIASGIASRVAGDQPKQYLPLWGKPMLWHAIGAVCRPPVENVFVVLAPGDDVFARGDWSAYEGKLEPLYCGGATRRDSVFNGLVAAMAMVEPDDWILVHDAARPCLPPQDLESLIAEAGHDAIGGILALPVIDTIKRAAKDEAGAMRVAATEDRTLFWHAQTPQMFRCRLLMEALKKAPPGVTDEASAVEHLGHRPRLVAGSRENLKVTFAEDLGIAEAILARRGSQ